MGSGLCFWVIGPSGRRRVGERDGSNEYDSHSLDEGASMNRKDLAAKVADRTDLDPRQADAAIDAVLEAIMAGVTDGERVSLGGFGTFERRTRAARAGRNPQTGEPITIAATVAPAFKPASAFKQSVAGG
ncbi:HU family DNA-binding protein [Nocardioides bizhenqiangii]|nr:HU family DNA-binding protein [Nocardioides sp. HM61]